ncbi:MAG: DUF2279 domain-containing protein [Calditrichaeota bacterium]|nr:DUF2279 domain-containing protein [Calditrichota bacterium]
MMKLSFLFSLKNILRIFLISAAIFLLAAKSGFCQFYSFAPEMLKKSATDSDNFFQNSQHSENFSAKKIHYKRLALASAGLLALNIAAYQPFKETWWNEERTHFHLYRGWRRTVGCWDFGWNDSYYGHMDKLGHYYSGKIMSEQIANLSNWIGFSRDKSQWIGPVMSSLLMLEIEIYDGFFKEWGFSLADFTANELGAFAPLVGKKFPFWRRFSLKFSYHPSRQPQNEPTFIKDYAGMTYWLSCDVREFLPKNLKNHYPQWLNFALGYGVSKQAHGDVEIYLAPDINWEKVYRGSSESLKFFLHALNYLHFPNFALKITPQVKFYYIYF